MHFVACCSSNGGYDPGSMVSSETAHITRSTVYRPRATYRGLVTNLVAPWVPQETYMCYQFQRRLVYVRTFSITKSISSAGVDYYVLRCTCTNHKVMPVLCCTVQFSSLQCREAKTLRWPRRHVISCLSAHLDDYSLLTGVSSALGIICMAAKISR